MSDNISELEERLAQEELKSKSLQELVDKYEDLLKEVEAEIEFMKENLDGHISYTYLNQLQSKVLQDRGDSGVFCLKCKEELTNTEVKYLTDTCEVCSINRADYD